MKQQSLKRSSEPRHPELSHDQIKASPTKDKKPAEHENTGIWFSRWTGYKAS